MPFPGAPGSLSSGAGRRKSKGSTQKCARPGSFPQEPFCPTASEPQALNRAPAFSASEARVNIPAAIHMVLYFLQPAAEAPTLIHRLNPQPSPC